MTRTLRYAGPPLITFILAFILSGWASAATIKLGPVREQTIGWLMESKHLSRAAAEQMMDRYARRNRAEILDEVEAPDGAVLDFVEVDASGRGPVQVRNKGCGAFFSPGSDFGREYLAWLESIRGTPSYNYFKARWAEAVKRGYFVQTLTPEQRDRLLHAGERGPVESIAAATPIRILVASVRMPPWPDSAPSTTNVSHGHPIHPPGPPDPGTQAIHGQTAGGGWNNGQRAGMNTPAWNETHDGHNDPVNGPASFVYPLRTDFVEHWYNFLYDYSNPLSVGNFYRENSHGHVAINGDRSDIAAWVESHHICDVNPFGQNYDYTPMPGTPIVREIDPLANYIFRMSVETGQFSVLFRDHGVGWSGAAGNLSNYQFTFPAGTAPDSPPYYATSGTRRIDSRDDRHVTFTGVTYQYFDTTVSPNVWRNKTVNNDTTWSVVFLPTGDTASGRVGQGCSGLPDTTITDSEANTALLQSRLGNRLLSLCYYTHDHQFNPGASAAERPYQLQHIENSRGYTDDIMGTSCGNLNYHLDRPFPYDHDLNDDTNRATGGFFGTGHHTTGGWVSDFAQVLADWGVSGAGYQRVIYTYPNGAAVAGDDKFIPEAGGFVVLPENAGLGVTAHELGHTFGFADLYDTDFYRNNQTPPPQPPFYESDAMGPYSVMANGGLRVDAFSKLIASASVGGPWFTPTLLAVESPPGSGNWLPKDQANAPIPQIEGTLQNPIVYKALPDLATGNVTSGAEYFLVENRNQVGYFGDPTPRGMYIYHIDLRFGQTDEVYFGVIMEQADGLYQLERMGRGWNAPRPDAMAGDPFPGSLGIRQFTQWGQGYDATNPSLVTPDSRSHGRVNAQGKPIPGSSFDTFFRADAISDPAQTMHANLWVQPHELVATAINRAPPTCYQGDKNVPILQIHLNNDGTAPNISQGDVVIRDIVIDESGNSQNDADVARALCYYDVGGDGVIVPGTDVLLGTAPVANQRAILSNLSYRVAFGQQADLLIAFDIADTAQTTPQVTVGAGIDHSDPNSNPANPWSSIICQIPGVIQERVRLGPGTWGATRFPLRSDADKTVILEAPDTLTVKPTDVAPDSVLQGTQDVEMLAMRLSVNRDSVILDGLRVDTRGSSNRPGDVSAKLYDDPNLNGVIDPGESVVDTAQFYVNGAEISAMFDDLGGYTVVPGTNRGLIVVYDFATDASPGKTVTARLANRTYITLRDAADRVSTENFAMTSKHTLILKNNAPTLTAMDGGTRNWLAPTRGTPITNFVWTAKYTDAENDPPSPVPQVYIDDVAYNMTAVNPVDTNYTDGADFRLTRRLPVGNHTYYMTASDGASVVRYPRLAPDVYPQPVVLNNPPTLSNATVTPPRGSAATAFLYEITFTDVDGHAAAYVQVMIDGGAPLPMVEQDPADLNTRDGKVFELAMPAGSFTPGAHKCKFEASDGFDVVTYPSHGDVTGPIIDSPSAAFFADNTYTPVAAPYEEGGRVFIQVTDIDQNVDVGARDTLDVTVTVQNGGDSETVTLLETALDTGIFRTWPGGVPTLGRAGAADDGTINVAAGPAGNTLILDYRDPGDPTDTQTLTAGVIDTQAPAVVKLVDLLAAANADGSQVTVNFTAYDEAAQIDVARYDVFYETAPGPITLLTPAATLPAGTRTVQIATGGPGPDMYVAVAVYDEVPNVDPNVKWRKVSTRDTNPPVLLGESPADNSTDVPLDTNILFRIDDAGSGVAAGDIKVRVRQDPADGGAWTNVTPSLVITGSPGSRNVSYDPPVDFLYNQRVYVEVTAADIAGNSMTQTFSFLTAADANAPVLQNADPADGATDVPIDTNIGFELTDDRAGVDPASIHTTVNGTDVTSALQLGGTGLLTTVLYDPPTDFSYGETVTVTVDATDLAGNAMSTVLYSFTTLPDVTGVVIDQLTPADKATDVPIDTPISFRVYDATSGVDKASVQLLLDGVQIPLVDANFKQLSPTSYVVTYQPPTAFGYNTVVKARATAKDLAGNPRTGLTWTFRTELPPVYSITGTIQETVVTATTSTVGVPGVKVRIADFATGKTVKTVTSVGTGVFEATDLLDGTYVVEPSLTDYTFVSRKTGKPTQRVYVGMQDKNGDGNPELDANGVDFDATHRLYAIEGEVLEGGQGLAGVDMTDGTRTATTDANGKYRIENVPSGTYSVTPSLTNYSFNPASRTAVVASAKATGIDFTATARTFSVSGMVQDADGNRLSGVKVSVEGGTSVAVTSLAGQYTLTGIKAGMRTVIAERDGYLFGPAPGVTTANIQINQDLSGIDFIGYPLLTRTFTAGTHFIGLPAVPRDDDPLQVFGTQDVARWDPYGSPPQYITPQSDPTSDVLTVAPARGFFLRYGQKTAIQVAGTPVSTTAPYVFTIDQGWSMAANPFPSAIGFANLSPSAANAVAPYGFVLEDGKYTIVSDIARLGGRRWLDGWEGVWLLSDVPGASITALPPGTGTSALTAKTADQVVNRDNWSIPIVARAAGTTDDCTTVGVSSATGALSAANPPPLPSTVDVVLQGANGRALACDLKRKTGTGLTWRFQVVAPTPNVDVELTLPDLTQVPQDLSVTLVDVAAGKSLYARTMPSYVYNSGQSGTREFRLEVKPRLSAGLTLRPAGAQLKGSLAAVTYVLSAEAEVSARVLNIIGRPVRTLTRGTSAAAGTNTLSWDLTSDAQTRVPRGSYLVEIAAVTQDGQRATTVQPLFVDR